MHFSIFLLALLNVFLSHAALIGNYKFYNSAGNAIYDFSSNEMHAEVSKASPTSSLMVSTDRGTYISNMNFKFPNNQFKSYTYPTTMNLSYFFMATSNAVCLNISITNTSGNMQVSIKCATGGTDSTISFLENGASKLTKIFSDDTASNS